MALRLCVVTSSRADWGAIAPLAAAARAEKTFDLSILATGQHLDRVSGNTARQIQEEGFEIAETVDMQLLGDTPSDLSAALGRVLAGFGNVFAHRRPDLVIVPGDRYEILGVTLAAALARIPVAHLGGGDVTEGAMDDAFRHAITKLAHLHFVTNADAAARVRQLGEPAEHVFNVGSTALDRIRATPLMDRQTLFQAVGLVPRPKNLLVTFHPETLAADSTAYCNEMLAALERLQDGVGVIFSGTNADVQGIAIGRLIEAFVKKHANAVLHPTLGSSRYFSALSHADAIVGNSSSGLYEAPSFGLPTVNIGDRQKGRLRAASVIDVVPTRAAIHGAIVHALARGRVECANPYGDGHSAERIVTILREIRDPQRLLRKSFVNRP